MTLERPLIFKDTPTAYVVVDDLLPKEDKRPLDFRTFLCVARKPTLTAARFNTAPDFPHERRQDRFNQEALNPLVEGNLTRWRYAACQGVPELTCPRCRNIFPEGMLICMACGLSIATQSDMRRACQVFRMEELAEKLGFEFTLDLLGDDQVAGATRSANEARSVKSAAAVLKNHARSYMKQARKDGVTLLQRLGTDAHFAYNCSVQDLTPRCMHWVSVLGNSVLPSIRSTGLVRRSALGGCDNSRRGFASWLGIPTSPTSRLSWTSRCLCGIGIASTERTNSVPSTPSSTRGSGSHACQRQTSPSFPRRSPATRFTWTSSTTWPTRSRRQLGPLRRKAEAEPSPRRASQIQITTGLLDLGMDLTRDPTMGTPSRSGTTTTTSGPTTSGRSGVGATRGGNIEMTAVAITAENIRLAEAMAFCSTFSARGLMTSDA